MERNQSNLCTSDELALAASQAAERLEMAEVARSNHVRVSVAMRNAVHDSVRSLLRIARVVARGVSTHRCPHLYPKMSGSPSPASSRLRSAPSSR